MDKQTVVQDGGKAFCIALYANDDSGFLTGKVVFFLIEKDRYKEG